MANTVRDLTGQEFGYLTAVQPTEERSRYGVIWLARCRCGNEIKMSASDLSKKPKRPGQMPRSCGCFRKRNRSPKYKGIGDLSHTKWKNIQSRARLRGIEFDLSLEYAWNLFLAQGKKCALTGLPLALSPSSMAAGASTASLDRINSDEGYVEGNVQWVHVTINYMKQQLPQNDFVDWCRKVVDHSMAYGAEFGRPHLGNKPPHHY